jgi:hypothetical protein
MPHVWIWLADPGKARASCLLGREVSEFQISNFRLMMGFRPFQILNGRFGLMGDDHWLSIIANLKFEI